MDMPTHRHLLLYYLFLFESSRLAPESCFVAKLGDWKIDRFSYRVRDPVSGKYIYTFEANRVCYFIF